MWAGSAGSGIYGKSSAMGYAACDGDFSFTGGGSDQPMALDLITKAVSFGDFWAIVSSGSVVATIAKSEPLGRLSLT